MRLISFCKILFSSGCFTTVYASMNAQDKVIKKQDLPIDIDLWQNGLPNTNGMEAQGYDDEKNSFKSSVQVYLPKASQQPARAIIIYPGGGYGRLAMTHEGYDWVPFFSEQGTAVIILKYRMPNGNRGVSMSDVYETIHYAKECTSKWNTNPDCIGVMGFPVDGHLASIVATHVSEEFRPAFQILFCPVISMEPKYGHGGSCGQFLDERVTEELKREFSNEYQADPLTSRASIALSDNDRGVVPMNSIRHYSTLKEREIPAATYIYPSGGHGWGMKDGFKFRNGILMGLKAWLITS